MEDFGYSKDKETNGETSVAKRAFLLAATLFSIACFVYITINAYYFVYEDKNNNVETIKADANPIKVVEEQQNQALGLVDNSIYEDIFGTKKSNKEVKIRDMAEPAVPPKNVENVFEAKKEFVNSLKKNEEITAAKAAKQSAGKVLDKSLDKNKIIVYSQENPPAKNPVLLNVKTAPQTPQANKATAANTNRKQIRVQIAAMTSKESAQNYWRRIHSANPQLFSGLKAFVEEADLGKRGIFYRLQIGNFFDQIKAEEFCAKYTTRAQKSKADCIVVE